MRLRYVWYYSMLYCVGTLILFGILFLCRELLDAPIFTGLAFTIMGLTFLSFGITFAICYKKIADWSLAFFDNVAFLKICYLLGMIGTFILSLFMFYTAVSKFLGL